jgi:hypothetical protein
MTLALSRTCAISTWLLLALCLGASPTLAQAPAALKGTAYITSWFGGVVTAIDLASSSTEKTIPIGQLCIAQHAKDAFSRHMALRITRIFRASAMRTSFGGFPAARSLRAKSPKRVFELAAASCRLALQSGTRDEWSDLRHFMGDYFRVSLI